MTKETGGGGVEVGWTSEEGSREDMSRRESVKGAPIR